MNHVRRGLQEAHWPQGFPLTGERQFTAFAIILAQEVFPVPHFDDVISQEHITTTLKNQIATGQIAHAYLFTGTRCSGGSSRVFKSALNAESDSI